MHRTIAVAGLGVFVLTWTTVSQAASGTHAFTNLASFNGLNGEYPSGALVADASGNLYGTTQYVEPNGYGTVFELAAGTHALTTLVSFYGGKNGGHPDGGLIADANGNLYGTTQEGGGAGGGIVFELAAGTHEYSTLAEFDFYRNGSTPKAGLLVDAVGNLYGTTVYGGADYEGTLFEVAAGTHTLTALVTFDGTIGHQSRAALIADASGNLYGTMSAGGPYDRGTVFELAAGTHVLRTLATFDFTNGSDPEAGLIADASGNFYGTTYSGGANGLGTVFELSPVPEPSSLVLAALGFLGLAFYRGRMIQ